MQLYCPQVILLCLFVNIHTHICNFTQRLYPIYCLPWMPLFFFFLPSPFFSLFPSRFLFSSPITTCRILFCIFLCAHILIYEQLHSMSCYGGTIHFQPPICWWPFTLFPGFWHNNVVLLFLWYRFPEMGLLGSTNMCIFYFNIFKDQNIHLNYL